MNGKGLPHGYVVLLSGHQKNYTFFKEIALDKVFFLKYLKFFFRKKITFLLIFLDRNFFLMKIPITFFFLEF